MSRLRRLKERKRKNSIKATACSLALTLGIGIVQSTTTYALFTDEVQIDNHLSITMGKVDNEIGKGLNVDNLGIADKSYTKSFTIKNNSTVDQKIKLKFSKSKSHTLELKDFEEYIEHKIDIETSEGDKVWIDRSSGELFNEDKKTRLVLKPKVNLNCTSTISIKKKEPVLSKKIINFDITVLASQVNYIDGVIDDKKIGFTDESIQNNLVKIGEIVEPAKEDEEVPSEPEVVEPSNEEVEVPSEPEVAKPPKGEIELPSEPEAVKPPKEEVPSKPEVIEPPKKEEVVVPDQTDIIAQKKEETEIQE